MPLTCNNIKTFFVAVINKMLPHVREMVTKRKKVLNKKELEALYIASKAG
jgi:homocitrate synthase NifV